jgi:hypothetical protein
VQAVEKLADRNWFESSLALYLGWPLLVLYPSFDVAIVEEIIARLTIVTRTREQALNVKAGKSVQNDLQPVPEEGEEVLRVGAANGEIHLSFLGEGLHQRGVLAVFSISQHSAQLPVGSGGEAVLSCYEPRGNSGGQRGLQIKDHGYLG